MRVLVLNPGSSTLKAVVLEPPERTPLAGLTIELEGDALRSSGRAAAVESALGAMARAGVDRATIDAVGYRVVHGGSRFSAPALVDDRVLEEIAALVDLAPLHNPIAVDTIAAGRSIVPDVPHVAAFDTAFHARLAPDAYRYAVPGRWFAEWGIRRFGFHGLSVAWSVGRAAELLDVPADRLRVIVAHLGSGCSVSAVDGGRCVETSMGMTPLEGLVMGTRAGSLDPGIILSLVQSGRLDIDEVAEALEHGSGLLGLSGRTADVRELLVREAEGDEAAGLALAIFVRRAAAAIGSAATALPAVDAVVFTGGIGENAATIRARIVDRLGPLGVQPLGDDGGDASGSQDDILGTDPGPAVLRITAREDVVIADAVVRTLAR